MRLAKAKLFAVLSVFVLVGNGGVYADTIFSDSFSATNGTSLNGWTPTVGGAWDVTSGTLTISNDAVDTSILNPPPNFPSSIAFADFTRPLQAGQTLTLTFNTETPASGDFFTSTASGWAGISLFAGGTEEIFLGKPGYTTYWGTDQAIGQYTFPTITSAAEAVSFSYAYDTGDWDLTVGNQRLNGTMVAQLQLDQLRLGDSDYQSPTCDIKVSSIEVTATPEPSSLALAGLGGTALMFFRRRKSI